MCEDHESQRSVSNIFYQSNVLLSIFQILTIFCLFLILLKLIIDTLSDSFEYIEEDDRTHDPDWAKSPFYRPTKKLLVSLNRLLFISHDQTVIIDLILHSVQMNHKTLHNAEGKHQESDQKVAVPAKMVVKVDSVDVERTRMLVLIAATAKQNVKTRSITVWVNHLKA